MRSALYNKNPPQFEQYILHDATTAFLTVWYNKIETVFFSLQYEFIFHAGVSDWKYFTT